MAAPDPVNLLAYAPSTNTLDPQAVVQVRARLEAYLQGLWPEIDVRPNSVFGDLYVTPAAALTAALEIGLQRFQSDLDLTQLSQGIVFNPTFARRYLRNFGIQDTQTAQSSGLIWLSFSANEKVSLDTDLVFTLTPVTSPTSEFTPSGQTISAQTYRFNLHPGLPNPLVVGKVGDATTGYALFPTADGQFVVALPVLGTPGAQVADGAEMFAAEPIPNLVRVAASGEFDQGSRELSIAQMARMAITTYPAASLASRAGMLSFFRRMLPNAQWLGATVSGQPEMIRTGKAVLGLLAGAGDVFVKTRPQWATHTVVQKLTYNYDNNSWMGALNLPHTPSFFHPSLGIFQGSVFNRQNGQQTLYARATGSIDSPGVSFSNQEQLGVRLSQQSIEGFEEAYLSPVTGDVTTGLTLQVTGIYNGTAFGDAAERWIRVQVESIITIKGHISTGPDDPAVPDMRYVPGTATDQLTGRSITLKFVVNETTKTATADSGSPEYQALMGGLLLVLKPDQGNWPAWLGGQKFDFQFHGRTALFTVAYLFDPLLPVVQATLADPDYQPVNVSLLGRSPNVCGVNSLVVHYRTSYGQTLNRAQAAKDLALYINSLGYPRVYDDMAVSQIMQMNGATQVTRVTKSGIFYPSLASVWQYADGTQVPIPHAATQTLLPEANSDGLGVRNLTWWIDQASIQFVSEQA